MAWTLPVFPRTQVDTAGELLASSHASSADVDRAFDVLSNWRSSHAFPLNTFQVVLRHRARRIYPQALVAQRLKRVPSILYKLRRFPQMRLTQMQDIGGCRAVLRSVYQVRKLERAYVNADSEHQLVRQKDYIAEPKESGYRGLHLIYRFSSSKSLAYNDLLIEVQLRSHIQHAWATAVETVGSLIEHALKASEGPERWLKFFTLTASAFAHMERSPAVPGCPPFKQLVPKIREMTRSLGVHNRLRTYRRALRLLEHPRLRTSQYFLMELRPAEETLLITGYRTDQLDEATKSYLERERAAVQAGGAEVVLVRSDSVSSLRRAYPNYFLDTDVFLRRLDRIIA